MFYYRREAFGLTLFDVVNLQLVVMFIFSKEEFRIYDKNSIVQYRLKWVLFSFIPFFISGVLSSIVNIDKITSLNPILISITYNLKIFQLPLLVLIMLLFFKRNNKNYFRAKKIFLWGAYSQVIIGTFQQVFIARNNPDLLRSAVHGTAVSHHSVIAMIMIVCLPFVVNEFVKTESVRYRVFLCAMGLGIVNVIVASGSRSGLLALLIGIVIFILTSIKWKKEYFLSLLIIFIASGVVYEFTPLKAVMSKTFESSGQIDKSSYSRLLIWLGAIEAHHKAPLINKIFGLGIGLYGKIRYSFVIWSGHKGASGAHNNILHVLCETGIVGLLFFVYHWVVLLWRLYLEKSFLARSFLYLTIGLLVSGMMQETFWFQSAFGSFWAFYICAFVLVVCESHDLEKSNDNIKA